MAIKTKHKIVLSTRIIFAIINDEGEAIDSLCNNNHIARIASTTTFIISCKNLQFNTTTLHSKL